MRYEDREKVTEERATEEMQALWMSLKENVKCGSRLTDVIVHPEKHGDYSSCSCDENKDSKLLHRRRSTFGEVINKRYRNQSHICRNGSCENRATDGVILQDKYPKRRSYNPSQDNLGSKFILQRKSFFGEAITRRYHRRTQFCELNIGDPARNILQMIFQGASRNPSKPSHKIKRVLKVKNTKEVLERFEGYREMVKNHAYEQHKRHPRSIVDGNELLRFYGTTMSCCSNKSKRVSELCRDPACRICRAIQSNFDTEYTKNYGIRLSTTSDAFGDNVIAFSKKIERAVIVCRIIAGPVIDKVDGIHEECDSNGSEGTHSNSESAILRNPCAVLPCFVIVFG